MSSGTVSAVAVEVDQYSNATPKPAALASGLFETSTLTLLYTNHREISHEGGGWILLHTFTYHKILFAASPSRAISTARSELRSDHEVGGHESAEPLSVNLPYCCIFG
jgi:hypothetical protein